MSANTLIERLTQRRGVRQFLKFGVVGASGFIVNLVIFTVLQRVVPNYTATGPYRAIYSIAFLSGGQSGELACARLNAMHVRFKSRLPWALTFSFARAIQQPALEIWRGQEANAPAAQKSLRHRAECSRAARRGEYGAAMEK